MAIKLLMLAVTLGIAFLLIKAAISLYLFAEREADEDVQIRKKYRHEFEDARENLKRDTDRANSDKEEGN